MRHPTIRLLGAAALMVVAGCGSPADTATAPPQGEGASAGQPAETAAREASGSREVDQGEAETTYPEVARTRTGNGGVVALANEATFEFDYASGRCAAAEGKFAGKGADLNDPSRKVSFDYADIIDPNSGRIIGTAFRLEVRTGEDEVWAAHVGTGIAGKVADMSLAESPAGGRALSVTGMVAAFHNNGAMRGRTVPFRLEATCD